MIVGSRPISVWAVLPAVFGGLALGAGALLSPGQDEVQAAVSHFWARRTTPSSQSVRPAPRDVGHETYLTSLRTTSVETIWNRLSKQDRANASEAILRIAFDLESIGRRDTALALLMHANAPTNPAIWRLKVRLGTGLRRRAQALQLFSDALHDPKSIAMDDLIAIAALAGRLDQLISAVLTGKLARLSPPQGAEVARLLLAKGDFVPLDTLSRAAPGWDTQDLWLSFTVAREQRDWKRALSLAEQLPGQQAQQAVEDVLFKSGDRERLRSFYLGLTYKNPTDALRKANDLASLGMRRDAIKLLERFIDTKTFDQNVAARLIFLLGPRPERVDAQWLQQQALKSYSPQQLFWTATYASHDAPERAAVFLALHPRSRETSYALLLLATASDAGNLAGCEQAFRTLLDGRKLSDDQAEKLYQTARSPLTKAWAQRVLEWGLQNGLAKPNDKLALAWIYWDTKQFNAMSKVLAQYLATNPNDVVAVRLMADGFSKVGLKREAVFWNQHLLTLASPNTLAQAEAYERLGRFREALRVVEYLQIDQAKDRDLQSQRARLLLALGRPDDARRALR